MHVTVGNVSFADVVSELGIGRATAYRAVSSAGSDDPATWLRQSVLTAALRLGPGGSEVAATTNAASAELVRQLRKIAAETDALTDEENVSGEAKKLLASVTVERRTAALRSIVRVACEANYRAVVESPIWNAYIATASSLATKSTIGPPEMLEALRQGEVRAVQQFAQFYAMTAELFGMRLKAPYRIELFATLAAAAVEGLAIRAATSDYTEEIRRHTGPGGASESWTAMGIAFEALAAMMFEPDGSLLSVDLQLPDHVH